MITNARSRNSGTDGAGKQGRHQYRLRTGLAMFAVVLIFATPAAASTLIGTNQIQNLAVTTPKIANHAVTNIKVADGAVGASKLANGAVITTKIANGAVTAGKIGAGAVTTTKIGAGAVTTTGIADGAVTTAKIRNGAVDSSQLADDIRTTASPWTLASNFTTQTLDNSSLATATLAAPSLTATALANANISVFMTFGAKQIPLPYTSFAGGKVSTISYQLAPGTILITRFTADNSASVPLSAVLQYRWVITPAAGPGVGVAAQPNTGRSGRAPGSAG